MSFSIGETVIWRGTLAMVVSDQTIAGQEMVGVVPLAAIQYVPAGTLNQPVPQPAPGPVPGIPPQPPIAPAAHPAPGAPGGPRR